MTYKYTANGVFDFSRVEIFLISMRVEVFMELKKNLTRNQISTRAEFQLVFM